MIAFNKEGETPLDDISGLLIKGITTRAELDVVEADNILEAYLNYTINPAQVTALNFDTKFLQQLHKEMFCKVWSWAGEFRTTQTSIGIEAVQIRQALYQLIDDLKFWQTSWHYEETAVRLHYSLVKIHPFLNGNGRWARLATDIWLLSIGKDVLEWGGNITDEGKSRSEYITALQEADSKGYERLHKFMFP